MIGEMIGKVGHVVTAVLCGFVAVVVLIGVGIGIGWMIWG